MKRLILILGTVGLLLSLAFSPSGCRKRLDYPRIVSPTEANDILKATLPVPTYLPEGFQITGIYALEHGDQSERLVLAIADRALEDGGLTNVPLKMYVTLLRAGQVGGLKLVGETYDIAGTRGVLVTRDNGNELWWIRPYPDPPGQYELTLTAVKEIPREELVKIARSVEP